MPSPEIEKLLKYIDDLIVLTRQGTFQWDPINPTTYVWLKPPADDHGARISLQRIVKSSTGTLRGLPSVHYILQVSELAGAAHIVDKLNVSGEKTPEVNEKLKALFALIRSGLSEQGLDYLGNILNLNKRSS